jgi:hypothetical protein
MSGGTGQTSFDSDGEAERRAAEAERRQRRDAAARSLAGMLDAQGFVVIDGTLGFMNVEAGPATLQDVLYETHKAKRLRVLIVDLDNEPPAARLRAAAGLNTPRRRTVRGAGLPLEGDA